MRIYCNEGNFDLPLGFSIEIHKTNPFLTGVGDQSVPLTLPPTKSNLALLNCTENLNSLYHPIKECTVYISDGIYSDKGKLVIDSISDNGIDCTIYINQGSYYNTMRSKNLSDIQWPTINPGLDSISDNVQEIMTNLLSDYNKRSTHYKDIAIAPIVTGHVVYSALNKMVPEGYNDSNMLPHGNYNLGAFPQSWYSPLDGSNGVRYAMGTGVVPCLKLSYIINHLFSNNLVNYTLDLQIDSYLKKHFEQLYVINNVADSIINGNIQYVQLLPDVEILAFLEYFETLFNGRFIVNEQTKTVTFKHLKDIITAPAQMNMTQYKAGNISYNAQDFVDKIIEKEYQDYTIRFGNNSVPNKESVPLNLYDWTQMKYYNFTINYKYKATSYIMVDGMTYDPAIGLEESGYQWQSPTTSTEDAIVSVSVPSVYFDTVKFLNSVEINKEDDDSIVKTSVDQDKEDRIIIASLSDEMHTSQDSCIIECTYYTYRQYIDFTTGKVYDYTDAFFTSLNYYFGYRFFSPIGWIGNDVEPDNVKKENINHKITQLYDQFYLGDINGNLDETLTSMGDDAMDFTGLFLMMEHNIYYRYYKDCSDFYSKSNIDFSVKVNIPLRLINQIDMTLPVIFMGQKVLIKELKYQVGSRALSELTLTTIRGYELKQ